MVAEPLVTGQFLHLELVALAHRQPKLSVDLQAATDYLLRQLGVCRECDVLLLHCGVDE